MHWLHVDKQADVATFSPSSGPIEASSVVAKRNWSITFETGKATFTPSAQATLDELYNQLLVGGALAVQIEGHTDSVGNPEANLILSQRRADAVKAYLQAKSSKLFPDDRVTTIGFGDRRPIADNSTKAGQAANRRVTIVLGSQN
jgi:outer membrane protein OmpA-like peptidoglycan-associated protein